MRLSALAAVVAATVVPLLEGEVELVRGSTVTLRGPQGQRVDVEVGTIHAGAERLLLPGRRVALLGIVAEDEGRLRAQGITVEYGRPAPFFPRETGPAASPPTARPSPSPVPAPAAPPPPPPPPPNTPFQAPAPVETPPAGGAPPPEPALGPGPAPTPR